MEEVGQRSSFEKLQGFKSDRSSNVPKELPSIRRTGGLVTSRSMNQQPLPTSLQADFLPPELLFALTEVSVKERSNVLHSGTKIKRMQSLLKKAPANLFNFASQRERMKHLTDQTPCICGAGKDISFLYDVPLVDESAVKPNTCDKSSVRNADHQPKQLELPDTLIPDEYHIVKNRKVQGLDYTENKYGLEASDHDKHLVLFPSMKPSTRFEVIQLKKTMDEMLQTLDGDDMDISRPTQVSNVLDNLMMHNLLKLLKDEQNIYNVVFHELIRQVSIHCMERGCLLADIRKRYSDLLSRVPKQVKGLHEEVLAQRALDRRLTEELLTFKTTISHLTSELSRVKEHDESVTLQANETESDLKLALSESQKNSALLSEYHDLYELQRARLEGCVNTLANEKEQWRNAAYCLALKVTNEHSLNTAKRLHITEKAWAKLAQHFTVLLRDRDTEILMKLQNHSDVFRDNIDQFRVKTLQNENQLKTKLNTVKDEIKELVKNYKKTVLGEDGNLEITPNIEKITEYYEQIHKWSMLFSFENERFGGENLLSGQENLRELVRCVDGWTDCALKLFSRHKPLSVQNTTSRTSTSINTGESSTQCSTATGKETPPNLHHVEMSAVRENVEECIRQFQFRISGENGVALHLITMGNSLETWENKFNVTMHGGSILLDREWMNFYGLISTEWITIIESAIDHIGTTKKEDCNKKDKNSALPNVRTQEHKKVDIFELIRRINKWTNTSVASIDSDNTKLSNEVNNLNNDMIHWMIQMLLRLAPNRRSISEEAKDNLIANIYTLTELENSAVTLCDRLMTFSKYISVCCNDLVLEDRQDAITRGDENPDQEFRDLLKLQAEYDEWTSIVRCLLTEVGITIPVIDVEMESQAPAKQSPSNQLLLTTMTEEDEEEEYEETEETEEKDEEQQKDQSDRTLSITDQQDGSSPHGSNPSQCLTTSRMMSDRSTTLPSDLNNDTELNTEVNTERNSPEAEQINCKCIQTDDIEMEIEHVDPGIKLEILGSDANTYTKRLDDFEVTPKNSISEGAIDENSLQSVRLLQQQLVGAEERAQSSEQRYSEIAERLRLAEKEIRKLNQTQLSRPASATSPVVKAKEIKVETKPDEEEIKPEIKPTEIVKENVVTKHSASKRGSTASSSDKRPASRTKSGRNLKVKSKK